MHEPEVRPEPTQLTAGDSWRWSRAPGGHEEADGWELVYFLQGKTPLEIATDFDPEEELFQVQLPPSGTGAVEAGIYQLHGFFRRGEGATAERVRAYSGTVQVAADPATAEARRSHVEETFELLEAAIEGRIPKDRESFSIDGTQITRIPMAELVRLRGIYAQLLEQQLNPAGSPLRRVVTRDVV